MIHKKLRLTGAPALAILAALALSPFSKNSARADDVSHRAAAEELLATTHVDQMMATLRAQQKEMLRGTFTQMMPQDLPPEKSAELQKKEEEIFNFVMDALSWEKLKPDF